MDLCISDSKPVQDADKMGLWQPDPTALCIVRKVALLPYLTVLALQSHAIIFKG